MTGLNAPQRDAVALAAWMLMLLAAAPAVGRDAAGDKLPADPDFDDVSISPDGEYVAATARTRVQPSARNLVTLRLSDRETIPVTEYSDSDVIDHFWANDDRRVDASLAYRFALGRLLGAPFFYHS